MSTEIDNWAKKYEDLTNGDETIKAMAKYYTCSFMFDMENAKVIIEMHDGKVKNINNANTKIFAVYNILGKLSKKEKNSVLFYIYEDGKVEKKILLE